MALLNEAFDATEIEPASFDIMPAGKYLVHVVESEMRPTSSGDGQFLSLRLDILDGEFKGRALFDRLNLVNPNQQTVEIARRQLSALCHAAGKLAISDSEELHFIPVIANVRVRPVGNDKKGVYRDASNEIRGYSSANGSAAAPQQRMGKPTPIQAQQPAGTVPPWKKRAS